MPLTSLLSAMLAVATAGVVTFGLGMFLHRNYPAMPDPLLGLVLAGIWAGLSFALLFLSNPRKKRRRLTAEQAAARDRWRQENARQQAAYAEAKS